MKYLERLAESLMHTEPPEARGALRELLETYDQRIQDQVRVEYGELIPRNRLAEYFVTAQRDAMTALVEACCDAGRVPPQIRTELERTICETMDAIVEQYQDSVPTGGDVKRSDGSPHA